MYRPPQIDEIAFVRVLCLSSQVGPVPSLPPPQLLYCFSHMSTVKWWAIHPLHITTRVEYFLSGFIVVVALHRLYAFCLGSPYQTSKLAHSSSRNGGQACKPGSNERGLFPPWHAVQRHDSKVDAAKIPMRTSCVCLCAMKHNHGRSEDGQVGDKPMQVINVAIIVIIV